MRVVWVALFAVAAAPLTSQDGAGFNLGVKELVLDNGMRVLVVERHEVPRVFCSLWWRVGSVNEHTGGTGLSHFFEHMMFKGTERIGTTDPKKDAELNDKIEATMTKIRTIKLARLEAQRRGMPPDPNGGEEYKTLWKQYEDSVKEQRAVTISEHFSKLLQAAGGTGLNASTSFDRTNYFVELPANKVELFFWLEADRFSKPIFREFYPEREVVKEERRMRTDSTPTGLINEAYWAMFWQAHPYHWPVIGWMSDIDEYTLTDAQRYFDTHYSPQNCTAVIVGDTTADEVFALAKRYFGMLKRSKFEAAPVVTQEPEQTVERRISAEADSQPSISIRWHGPAAVHKDAPILDLVMEVFSGRAGRLHLPLVETKKMALNTSAFFWALRYGGMVEVRATPRPDAKFEDLEAAMMEQIENVRKNGVTETELQKAKNQTVAQLAHGMQDYSGIASQIGYYETVGTWHDLENYMRIIQAATVEDLKRCANVYLKPNARNILWIKRREKK